jgi:hypothetical protein
MTMILKMTALRSNLHTDTLTEAVAITIMDMLMPHPPRPLNQRKINEHFS